MILANGHMYGSKFRCAGDIIFDDVDISPGQICNVQLKPFSETCNFLQYQKPLSPEKPYFFAQIRTLGELFLGLNLLILPYVSKLLFREFS